MTHMASEMTQKVVGALEAELEKIWSSEPDEVLRLKQDPQLLGAFNQRGSTLLYPNFETGEMQLLLFNFKLMAKSEEVSAGELGMILAKCIAAKANQWRRYYGMRETPSLIEEAALTMETLTEKAELVAVIDALNLYVGRLSFWFDAAIPWADVCAAIDANLT